MKRKVREKLTERFAFRCTEKEANRIKWLAEHYAGHEISEWLRHAALTGERRHLTLNEVRKK